MKNDMVREKKLVSFKIQNTYVESVTLNQRKSCSYVSVVFNVHQNHRKESV